MIRVVALLLLLMASAHACPICFTYKEGTREAFVATMVVMSLLPLSMVFGGAFLIRRYIRSHQT